MTDNVQKTSIKDVAKEAQVSTKTVSRVVNGLPYVSEEIRKRVWGVVEKHNYFPSEEGRRLVSLRKKNRPKTGNVGCIIFPTFNKHSEPFFAELLEEVDKALAKLNLYNHFICSLQEFDNKSVFLKTVNPNYVDGCLLIGVGDFYSEEILKIRNRVENLTIISDYVADNSISSVYPDGFKAGYLATKYLISLGHKKIACITGHLDRPGYPQLRLEGYKKALTEEKIDYKPGLIKEGKYSIEGAIEATDLLIKAKHRPTAIFVVSDQMAIGVYKAIQKNRLRIPEDISVVGCDNIEISVYLHPSLTTLSLDKKEMVKASIKILMEEIKRERRTPVSMIFPVKLIERQSCKRLN